ncbi:hypothetical protein AAEY33_12935 [Peribacillus simplex]|jgi:hypothetical protein
MRRILNKDTGELSLLENPEVLETMEQLDAIPSLFKSKTGYQ